MRLVTVVYISLICLSALLLRSGQAQLRFLPLNVDYATFYTPAGESYAEIYLSFSKISLTYQPTDSLSTARFSAHFDIYRDQEVELSHTQNFISHVKDVERLRGQEFRHVFPVKLSPGKYRLKVVLTDQISGARGEYERQLQLWPPDSTTNLSDIQLAVKIAKAGEKGLFTKNGLNVIPNPSGVYHIALPMLYYYCEAYNLPFSPETPGAYTVESYITDKTGAIVRTFPVKRQNKSGSSAVLVGGSNIVTLASDAYFFNLKLTDEQSGESITRSKRFVLFKPTKEQLSKSKQIGNVTTKLMLSYYLNLDESEIDKEFDQSRYIADKLEKAVYPTLDKKAKAEFLVEFWKKRDPDPNTPQNEFKIQYFELVRYCSQFFRTKFKEGWKTDRGRVLLTYGKPNDIQRNTSMQGSKPYEIWRYDELEGGSEFIFGDLRGFGEYELLHSTYSRELHQPDWKRLILRNRNDVNATESTRF